MNQMNEESGQIYNSFALYRFNLNVRLCLISSVVIDLTLYQFGLPTFSCMIQTLLATKVLPLKEYFSTITERQSNLSNSKHGEILYYFHAKSTLAVLKLVQLHSSNWGNVTDFKLFGNYPVECLDVLRPAYFPDIWPGSMSLWEIQPS